MAVPIRMHNFCWIVGLRALRACKHVVFMETIVVSAVRPYSQLWCLTSYTIHIGSKRKVCRQVGIGADSEYDSRPWRNPFSMSKENNPSSSMREPLENCRQKRNRTPEWEGTRICPNDECTFAKRFAIERPASNTLTLCISRFALQPTSVIVWVVRWLYATHADALFGWRMCLSNCIVRCVRSL